MTEIVFAHYSCGMISEFHDLSEKISQLAELAQALRRENAELRRETLALTAQNAELSRRMNEAQARVDKLLEALPAEPQVSEAEEV